MEEVLHIKNVSKVYEGKVPHTALKNINLHVNDWRKYRITFNVR